MIKRGTSHMIDKSIHLTEETMNDETEWDSG